MLNRRNKFKGEKEQTEKKMENKNKNQISKYDILIVLVSNE